MDYNLTSEELWNREIFETYPALVAHEYWRLYDLLSEKQIYGSLLQIKDLFEVILKLPVLAGAASLYKKERTPEENRLLIALFGKSLSLGDWESIGNMLYKQVELPSTASKIRSHLQSVIELFKNLGIVKWRNDVIGHGALSLNEAHEVEEDIIRLLSALRDFFKREDDFYKNFKMIISDGSSERVLAGKESARLKKPENEGGAEKEKNPSRENLRLRCGEFAIDLYPFAFLSGGDIFTFDSYLYHKGKSQIMNYPRGFRRTDDLPEITGLMKSLEINKILSAMKGGYSGETYLEKNSEILQSLFNVDDFCRPDHLVEWLKNSLSDNKKGVLHLAMEMGMGKSTFARSIDPMRSGDKMTVKLRNIEIRSYYLNDSYLGTVNAFCNTVNDIFNRDSEGNKLFNSAGSSLPLIQPGSDTPGKDLAALLNFYRNAYERHYGSSRILFIIDGVEEVPASSKGSVLDFIPGAEDLDDGVFVLITSRTDEELPLHVRSAEALKKENLACSVTVDRAHEGYRSVLNGYAQKFIAAELKRHGSTDIKNLLEKSEYRFLYVRLFRDLLRSFDAAVPGKLPEGGELLEAYLERMESLYGEKFYSAVADLLAILAGAYEPLTLNEIAYLYGNKEPDFLMLAHLADLRGFLKTERSYRGNLISLHV